MVGNIRTEILARACHAAWFAYTVLGKGEEGHPWWSAPEWQKESIRDAIGFWDEKLAGIEDLSNEEVINLLAPLSHENWMAHKQREGWVYGTEKDPEAKTHPCMVPYADLPEDQKVKDEVVLQAYLTVSRRRTSR